MEEQKVFGFMIGSQVIDMESYTEKGALITLIRAYWDEIDKAGEVQLLGEMSKSKGYEKVKRTK